MNGNSWQLAGKCVTSTACSYFQDISWHRKNIILRIYRRYYFNLLYDYTSLIKIILEF